VRFGNAKPFADSFPFTFTFTFRADKLSGREQAIFDERDRKLAEAREQRACKRRQAREEVLPHENRRRG